jgi:hypothetical protein
VLWPQEELLKACTSSLFGLSDSISGSEELKMLLANSGALKAVVSSIKAQPKLEESVTSGLAFLKSYSQVG